MNRKTYTKVKRQNEKYEITNLIELYDYRIRTAPDVPLYTFTDYQKGVRREIMPGEFKEHYQALGTWIRKQHPDRIHMAILGDNSYEWILTMQAAICSNHVLVPVDRSLEPDTIAAMLKASDCQVLFYSGKYQDKADYLVGQLGVTAYCLEKCGDMLEMGRALLREEGDGGSWEKTDVDAPALLVFTSGTQGRSKCVMLSLRNIISNAICTGEQMRLFYDMILFLPFHHVYGLNIAHYPYLINGKTVHINQNPRDLFRDIQAENPEVLVGVPLFVELFYKMVWKDIRERGLEERVRSMIEVNRANPERTMEEKRDQFKDVTRALGTRLKGLIVGGAAISDQYYDGFRDFGLDVNIGYGITECSPLVSATYVNGNRPGSVGRVLMDSEMMIDRPNERGEGEICVRSKSVMLGYYKDEEATREVIRDGWFHTGDIGYIDEDDFVYLCGRIKNLIILSNGENVSPEELESILVTHPGIEEVVVYEKRDRIAAQIYMAPDYEEENPEERIRRFVMEYNDSAASFKQISIVEFRDTPFGRNASQKILRSSVQ